MLIWVGLVVSCFSTELIYLICHLIPSLIALDGLAVHGSRLKCSLVLFLVCRFTKTMK